MLKKFTRAAAAMLAMMMVIVYVPELAAYAMTVDDSSTFSTSQGSLEHVKSEPENSESGVSVDTKITVYFDSAIVKGETFDGIKLGINDWDITADGNAAISGSTLVFLPTDALEYSAEYKLTIPAGAIEDADGVANTSDIVISFTTVDENSQTIEAPVISPSSGKITLEQEITISCAESGASIYYTTDGGNPAADGVLYTEPFTLNEASATVRAVAVLYGAVSKETVADYTIVTNTTTTKWSQNFGGSGDDYFKDVIAAEDGCVVVGYSEPGSFGSGDWSGTTGRGDYDAIIVKYDDTDNIEWSQNFGGSGIDDFNAVTAAENGYVAVGYSASGSFGSGDWGGVTGKGSTDAIIVKYDTAGNVKWKKNFGGSGNDYFYGVTTADDGYIAVGYSASGSFGSGDWSNTTGQGDYDTIIVKYDTAGNVKWKKNFGGIGNDYFYDVTTADDGYIAVGTSVFGSGDWSGTTWKGNNDAIIVKYDTEGNIEWKKNFGGSGVDSFQGVAATEDSYVAVGYSASGSFGSGDWSNTTRKGGDDAIIVKYDTDGNIEWSQNFGGSGNDYFADVTAAEDGYVAAGRSYSDSFGSGDWSNTTGQGGVDAIIVKYGTSGNVEQMQNFGGSGNDYFADVTITEDGYAAVGNSVEASFGSGDWSDTTGKGGRDATIVKYSWDKCIFYAADGIEAEVCGVGEAYTITSQIPEKEGCSFAGWTRNKNVQSAEYAAGDEITITESITLYPVWEEAPAAQSVRISSASERLKAGSEFTAAVYFIPEEDAAAVNVKVTYPAIFTLEEKSSEYNNVSMNEKESGDAKTLTITCGFSEDNPTLEANALCVIAELSFSVADEADAGVYEFAFSEGDCYTLGTTYRKNSLAADKGASFEIVPAEVQEIFIIGMGTVYGSYQYKVTAFPQCEAEVEWSVSDGSAAEIDENGVLTPIKNGSVEITAVMSDGSGIEAAKTVVIDGTKTYITALSSDVGEFAKAYGASELERVLYVPEGTESIYLTADYDDGLVKSDSGMFYPGVEKEIYITSLPQTLTFTKTEDDYTDTEYTLVIMEAAEGTGVKFTDGASVKVSVEEAGKYALIFAAYDENGIMTSAERREITFIAAGSGTYTPQTLETDGAAEIKAMLWKSGGSLQPMCAAAE